MKEKMLQTAMLHFWFPVVASSMARRPGRGGRCHRRHFRFRRRHRRGGRSRRTFADVEVVVPALPRGGHSEAGHGSFLWRAAAEAWREKPC